MPRSYRYIKEYESEILELKSQGYTKREIGKNIDSHTNRCIIHKPLQHKSAETCSKHSLKKGRPPKDYVVSEQDMVNTRFLK